MITAYFYRSCTSCRRAQEVLDEHSASYEVREFFKKNQGVSVKELKSILKAGKLGVADILSTRSTPYKQGNLAEKNLSDDDLLEMMTEEPRLLRRPILISGKHVVIGCNREAIENLITLDNAS